MPPSAPPTRSPGAAPTCSSRAPVSRPGTTSSASSSARRRLPQRAASPRASPSRLLSLAWERTRPGSTFRRAIWYPFPRLSTRLRQRLIRSTSSPRRSRGRSRVRGPPARYSCRARAGPSAPRSCRPPSPAAIPCTARRLPRTGRSSRPSAPRGSTTVTPPGSTVCSTWRRPASRPRSTTPVHGRCGAPWQRTDRWSASRSSGGPAANEPTRSAAACARSQTRSPGRESDSSRCRSSSPHGPPHTGACWPSSSTASRTERWSAPGWRSCRWRRLQPATASWSPVSRAARCPLT